MTCWRLRGYIPGSLKQARCDRRTNTVGPAPEIHATDRSLPLITATSSGNSQSRRDAHRGRHTIHTRSNQVILLCRTITYDLRYIPSHVSVSLTLSCHPIPTLPADLCPFPMPHKTQKQPRRQSSAHSAFAITITGVSTVLFFSLLKHPQYHTPHKARRLQA